MFIQLQLCLFEGHHEAERPTYFRASSIIRVGPDHHDSRYKRCQIELVNGEKHTVAHTSQWVLYEIERCLTVTRSDNDATM